MTRNVVRDDRPLMKVPEVAVRLGISQSMAWKMIADGSLAAVHIGRAIRVFPSDLDAYLAAHRSGNSR